MSKITPANISELHENLEQRLKDINAVLLKREKGEIEHYAGISELALFQDWRKVGVLTVGLFNESPKVRKLAAEVLKRDYALGETSDAVLKLLENQEDDKSWVELLQKIERLLSKPRHQTVKKQYVDYERQHALRILSGLGRKQRDFLGEGGDAGSHPLTQKLTQYVKNAIPKILKCLESKEVYCRREAIKVIGELNLNPSFNQSAFDLIIDVIDREENRHDYLVTRDGIRALTTLVKQNPDELERFFSLLRSFFITRTYEPQNEPWKGEEHRFYTRQECVEALGELLAYEQLKIFKADGERGRFVQTTGSYDRSKSGIPYLTRRFISVFFQIYQHEAQTQLDNNQLTERQQEILDLMSDCIGSADFLIRSHAINLLAQLPDVSQALGYLLKNAEANSNDVAELLSKQEPEKSFSSLLKERQELITVFYTVISKAQSDSAALIDSQYEAVYQLLRTWCFPIKNSNQQELKDSKNTRLSALWTLYNLSVIHPNIPLSPDDIQMLHPSQENDSFRSVLELFLAKHSGTEFHDSLNRLTTDIYPLEVRVCAKIELLIQTKSQEDLTEIEVDYIKKEIGIDTGIPNSLASRFLPILAKLNQPNATQLVKALIKEKRLVENLRIQLRENLSDYHCYHLEKVLHKMFLHDIKLRHKQADSLRLDYLNLLRAGKNQKNYSTQALQITDFDLEESESALQQNEWLKPVIKTLDDIFLKSNTSLLTVTPQSKPIAGLESLSHNCINTVLYSTETRDSLESRVKFYLYSQEFGKSSRVYLNRAMSDKEIARDIRSRINNDKVKLVANQLRYQDVRDIIVAKIEDVTDSGVVLDIGLSSLKPVVAFEEISPADIPENKSELYDKLLEFSIVSITFETSNNVDVDKILNIELSRKKYYQGTSVLAVTERTFPGTIVRIIDGDENNSPGVIFRIQEQDQLVNISELSWLDDSKWVSNGWRSWFEDASQDKNRIFELTNLSNTWSLRQNSPKLEYFVDLLSQKGSEEFTLVYVKQKEEGYEFEIEPGRNCYVPAERLVSNKNSLEFLLPDQDIATGDKIKVKFAEVEINGQKEVILENIDDWEKNERGITEKGEKRLRSGMRVVGVLSELDKTKKTAKLFPSFPENLEKSSYKFAIRNLPVDDSAVEIENGSEVSGKIEKIDDKRWEISLVYDIIPTPSQLELGQSYQCTVIDSLRTDRGEAYALKLRYGHVIGELRESYMTYGYNPVLANYKNGQKLRVYLAKPLEWKTKYKKTISVKNEKVISNLELDTNNSIGGDVVNISPSNQVTVELSNRRSLEFSLNDFNWTGEKPRIMLGWQIEFSRNSKGEICFRVDEPYRILFTTKPASLQNNKSWLNYNQILNVGQSLKCIYIAHRGKLYFFESETGKFFVIPQSDIKNDSIYLIYGLCVGDYITLNYEANGLIKLQEFEASPLSIAAEPWKFDDSQNQPLTILGKVAPYLSSDYGVYLELERIKRDKGDIILRKGIVSLYRLDKMSYQDKQRFLQGELQEQVTLEVLLQKTPELKDNGQLSLEIRNISSSSGIATSADKLREIASQVESNNLVQVEGKIESYDRKNERFAVTLRNDLSECKCWLHKDQVSFNLVRNSWYVEDFKRTAFFTKEDCLRFTVVSVNPENLSLEVSLKKNPPRKDIDQLLGKDLEWADNIIKAAAFIEQINEEYIPQQVEESEVNIEDEELDADELSDNIDAVSDEIQPENIYNLENNTEVEVISQPDVKPSSAKISKIYKIELEPGLIIHLPSERFLRSGRRLLSGDQMKLLVKKDGQHFSLSVQTSVTAEINRLGERRILNGSLSNMVGKKVKLKIEGYENYPCFLASEFVTQLQALKQHDLFRLYKRENQEIYFQPVFLRDLKAGDLLQVKYERHEENRLLVTFGNNHQGYINKYQISYRSDFNLSQFKAEVGDKFNARVREREENKVSFSLKDATFKNLDEYEIQAKLENARPPINAVLVKNENNFISIELEFEPGTVIRVKDDQFEIDSKLNKTLQQVKRELIPGDELLFQVISSQNQIKLRLQGIVQSIFHYLEPGILVRAQNPEFQSANKWQGKWLYSLPDYNNLKGILNANVQNPFERDLRLLIERIPLDPSRPLELRLGTVEDKQLVLQVHSLSGDRLQVNHKTGRSFINTQDATYRINNRISYLKKHLLNNEGGEVIVATNNSDKKGELKLSLRDNKPFIYTYLRRYLQLGLSQELELTYAGSQNNNQIFEIKPGELIIVPTVQILFSEQEWQWGFERFYPGDIFTVKIETQEPEEKIYLAVKKIELSIQHYLQRGQYIEAKVQEIVASGQGIVIKAKHLPLEQFISSRSLLGQSTSNYYEDQSLWLQVEVIEWENTFIKLVEKAKPSSVDEILRRDESRNREESPLIYGKISRRFENQVQLEVLNEKINISVSDLAWGDDSINKISVHEILLPEEQEQGLWVSVFKNKNYIGAKPKRIHSKKVSKFKKGQIVQAEVLKINKNNRNNPTTVLLAVDEIRTLVPHNSIVGGAANNLINIKPGIWLTACVDVAENNRLLVKFDEIKKKLDNLSSSKKPFDATVSYTLPHGLVFSYQGALGYISNQQLTWTGHAKAEELFQPGDKIKVYKVAVSKQQYSFSLKHESQSENIVGEISAIFHKKTNTGVYVFADNIWLFLSNTQLDSQDISNLEKSKEIKLQVIEIAPRELKIWLRPAPDESRNQQSWATEEEIRHTLDAYYRTSLKQFQRKLEKQNKFINLLANAYLDSGDYEKALELNSNYSLALYKQGEKSLKEGDYKSAIDKYTQALNGDRQWGEKNQIDAYFMRGVLYNQTQNYQAAINDFNQVYKENPNYPSIYYWRGMTHAKLENFAVAIDDLNRVLAQNNSYPDAYYWRGIAHLQQQNPQSALADFNQAIQIKPNFFDAYYQRGNTYLQLQNLQAALTEFYQVTQLQPNYIDAYFQRGKTYFKLDNPQAALAEFNPAIQLKSDYLEAYHYRGQIYLQLDNPQAALVDFNLVIERKTDDYKAYYYRGITYIKLNNPSAALEDFNQVIHLNPDDTEVYEQRGIVYTQLDNKLKAREDFQKAINLFVIKGELDNCRRILDRIESLNK